MAPMLAVFVSILAEQMAVESRLEVLERREVDGYPLTVASFRDNPVIVCRAGITEERGHGAAAAILNEFSPGAVLSARMACSFAGAARVGDLVLCGKSYVRSDDDAVPGAPAEADQRLLVLGEQAARAAGLRYALSNTLTADFQRHALSEYEALGRELDIAVVDANGHFLAEAAGERAIPHLSVRVAMGRVLESPPDRIGITAARGALRPRGVLAYCLRRPARLPGFMRLALNVRRSSVRLAAFMREFLREWSLEP